MAASSPETFRVSRVRCAMFYVACLALAACSLGILYLGAPARAVGASPSPTELTLTVPDEAKIGQDVIVKARLTSGGVPVTSRRVSFLLGDTPLGASSVNANGVADFRIRGALLSKAGQASVSAVFEGSLSLVGSEVTGVLNLTPAEITIRTVPAIDGIPILLGKQKGVTRGGGAVTFAVPSDRHLRRRARHAGKLQRGHTHGLREVGGQRLHADSNVGGRGRRGARAWSSYRTPGVVPLPRPERQSGRLLPNPAHDPDEHRWNRADAHHL